VLTSMTLSLSMKKTWLREKSEDIQNVYRGMDMTPTDKGLDCFVKRVQEDMAKNKISDAEGNWLIVMTTVVISMLKSQ
jgi:hypothetical protein